MKVVVNQGNCIGCGACESICPEIFQINDEGLSTVIGSEEDFNNHEEEIRDALDSCPTGAIVEDAPETAEENTEKNTEE